MTFPFSLYENVDFVTKTHVHMKNVKSKNKEDNDQARELADFPIDIKRDIIDIINDTPSIVTLGDNEYRIKNMRYYSLYRICRLTIEMRESDRSLDTDNKVLVALCTDFNAMCEIMAIVLCNHLFTPDDIKDADSADMVMSRNDNYVKVMKAKVMNSTFDENQWAAIVLGAIKSIDLSGFFLLRTSVNTLTDSLMTRKKKSAETVSQFMEAQSLLTPQTS